MTTDEQSVKHTSKTKL